MAESRVPKIPPLPKRSEFLDRLPKAVSPIKRENRMQIVWRRVAAPLGFVSTLLLLLVANRMSTSVFWSNGVLCLAWFVFLLTIYQATGILIKALPLRLIMTTAVGLLTGAGFYYFFWVSPPSEGILSISIVDYRYEQETQELVTRVWFANSGDVSRTVMGVAHIYRTKDMPDNEWKVLASAPDIYGDKPFNVDPKKPVLSTFRRKIDDRLAREDGTIFGLSLHTLNPNGRSNYTDVEAMVIHDGGIGQTGKRVEAMSLDEPWDKKLRATGKHTAIHTLNLPTKHEITTELVDLSKDGIALQERFTTNDVPTWDELNAWKEEVAQVLGYTESAEANKSRFETSSGFESLHLDGKSLDEVNRYRWVQQRMATLREFIKEFSTPTPP
jgi:hypothetical protein